MNPYLELADRWEARAQEWLKEVEPYEGEDKDTDLVAKNPARMVLLLVKELRDISDDTFDAGRKFEFDSIRHNIVEPLRMKWRNEARDSLDRIAKEADPNDPETETLKDAPLRLRDCAEELGDAFDPKRRVKT